MQDHNSTFDPQRLPNEMLAVDQFVNTKIEHTGVGKTRKVPKNPHLIGRHAANTNASTTNPATWASIDQAIKILDTHFTEVDGIGFVFRDDDPWLFIDLDNVRDPETGIIAQWAVDLIEKFPGTYVEISRSGKGLHLIIRSGPMLPPGGKSGQKWNLDNDQAIEIYWGRRYVWLTTTLYNGPCANPLPDHTAQVRALWDSLPERKVSTERNWGEDEPTPGSRRSVEEIVAKAEAAANRSKFRLLWRGEWKAVTDENGKPAYGSPSEADQAFVGLLSFWTGPHAGKIYELVKASGMYRAKWERDDYRERTIEGVLATRDPDDFYRWPNETESGTSSGPDKTGPFRLWSISDIENRPQPSYVVKGKLTLDSDCGLTGESGSGKSLIAADYGLSTAYDLPTADGSETRQGHVIYIVGEGIAGTGKRISGWKKARCIDFDSEYFHLIIDPLILTDDGDRLLATLSLLPEPPVLVIIDTLNRTFSGDENSAADMTAYIKAADRIRSATGCCVLIVHHHGKDGRYRGSSAFKASLDTILEVNRSGSIVTLSCAKQKDLDPFAPVDFRLQTVYIDGFNPDAFDNEDEPLFLSDLTSVVLQKIEPRETQEAIALTPKQLEALSVVAQMCIEQDWVKWSDWLDRLAIAKGTLSAAVKVLESRGLIETSKRGGPKNGPTFVTITADGWRYLKRSEATEPGPKSSGSSRTSTDAA